MAEQYTVFVDDNFHYMDEDERYKYGALYPAMRRGHGQH